MRVEYTPGTTCIHLADVRSKLIALAAVVVATFVAPSWWANLTLTALTVGSLRMAGCRWRSIGSVIGSLGMLVTLVFVFAALAPPPGTHGETLFYLWPPNRLPLTAGGLNYAAVLALRLVTMVVAMTSLVISTPLEQVVTLMQVSRLPHALVFITVTALRFIPTMDARARQIIDAQRARGARVETQGLAGKIRTYATIMVPLFVTGIRMSHDLSGAMVSRGYGLTSRPTRLYDLTWSWRDWMIVAASLTLVGAAVWSRNV